MTVEVRLEGTLIARAGARHARVPVPDDATVEDVVAALAEEYGPQVRPAILEGERLRTDTVAIRESPTPSERLSSTSHVHHGDTVRFQMQAY
ncbi:MoaD/ThiS family protein [Halorarius litoreus]|uniref:MoaD/ThiS family protein n=1 Tax=Halorarius litoreus TaxID=2962676 RepID=UPI0020CE7FC3|nr:hypothetical protein [Halorarius litoreus]